MKKDNLPVTHKDLLEFEKRINQNTKDLVGEVSMHILKTMDDHFEKMHLRYERQEQFMNEQAIRFDDHEVRVRRLERKKGIPEGPLRFSLQ